MCQGPWSVLEEKEKDCASATVVKQTLVEASRIVIRSCRRLQAFCLSGRSSAALLVAASEALPP